MVLCLYTIPGGVYQAACRPFLNFAVATFLFLSGMLSDADKWNPKKRIKKILIPYILWTMAYVIIGNFHNLSEIPLIFLKRLLLGNSAAIMYYVFVYCELTLLIPLIDKLAKSQYKYWGFVISPLEIICMRYMPLITGWSFNDYIQVLMQLSCLGWFTYYYLGYVLGNNIIKVKCTSKQLGIMWVFSIALQMLEGYYYLLKGVDNCGTQLKLTSILSGTIVVLLFFMYINSRKRCKLRFLHLIGDYSFGIYFSHIAIMKILRKIPFYERYVFYPVNAIIALGVNVLLIMCIKKILGDKSKYIAF